MKRTILWLRRALVVTAFAIVVPACANSTEYVRPQKMNGVASATGRSGGTLEILTYNVAGLPEIVSRVGPRKKHPHIGPRLAPYDLVLLQEDFCYHHLLDAPHTWQAKPRSSPLPQLGDGLARLSWRPLGLVEHVPWEEAHGILDHKNDRLAAKGFSLGEVEIEPGAPISVYNLHCDAGGHPGDRAARAAQFEQLIAHIALRVPDDRAMIVAGDFNCRPTSFTDLLEAADLTDAFDELELGGGIDRILYRSGSRVGLRALSCEQASGFEVDGRSLSDHTPVRARFEVTIASRN